MGYYNYFPQYVTVAERKQKAQKMIDKLSKKDKDISPVIVNGRTIANTWWGKSWNQNLERYADYSNRIARGRSYVRHGSVLDLKIKSGVIEALVAGSSSKPYKIKIEISALSSQNKELVKKACEGKIDSIQKLTEGKFPKDLSELFFDEKKGLFPNPKEIRFSCSCPDSAMMCKHIAATLYGIGVRLDEKPELFFELRQIDISEFVTEAIKKQSEDLISKSSMKSKRIIDDADVFDIFGIELDNSSIVELEKLEEKKEEKNVKTKEVKRKTKSKKAKVIIDRDYVCKKIESNLDHTVQKKTLDNIMSIVEKFGEAKIFDKSEVFKKCNLKQSSTNRILNMLVEIKMVEEKDGVYRFVVNK